MTAQVVSSFEDLVALRGRELGPGEWQSVDVEQAEIFLAACDIKPFVPSTQRNLSTEKSPAFASESLLLSLLGKFRSTVGAVRFDFSSRMNVFYGFEKVRFLEPVQLPSSVRLYLTVADARMHDDATIHVIYRHRLEVAQGQTVLLADAINRIYLNP